MPPDNRNVVLVTADSLRGDHCGFMNTSVDMTPALDQMATEGVVFENAIAPGPRTPSSIPEISTGATLPTSTSDLHGMSEGAQRIAEHISQHETIAERFAQMGYSTAAYTANPWTTPDTNFDTGFDQFHVVGSSSSGRFEQLFSGTPAEPVIRLVGQWGRKEDWFSQWETFYDDLIATIDHLPEPYFVWVFLLDTHNPYVVPRRDRYESNTAGMYYSIIRGNTIFRDKERKTNYRQNLPESVERRLKQAYRDSIRSIDRFVDTLQDDLTDTDPVMAFLADHGEAFGEHETYGHRRQLYEENIRVPFLIHNTGQSGRVQAPVSLRTLPDILVNHDTDMADLRNRTSKYVFSRTENDSAIAVRSERWKYISTDAGDELYDLSADPREQRNVVEEQEEHAKPLRDALSSFVEGLTQVSDEQCGKAIESDVENRLKSLGYR